MNFVDEVEIQVSSGRGGPGCVSFRRESMDPRGGPDGGDGGRGGHLVFKASQSINTLIDYRFRKFYLAANGNPGQARNMTGKDGEDLVLLVPVGTVIKDRQTGEVIKDFEKEEEWLFLKGGRGGKGNWFFRTSVNQAPDRAQPGESGEQRELSLELKLLADVGVVGFPNAGKSTLVSVVSAARPKIADYPFTTLIPSLGVVKVDENRSFIIADIPGLIPGAHAGVGLGTQFLKHIERTRLFVHLIDVADLSSDPVERYKQIRHELSEYDRLHPSDAPLSERVELVVLNKIDAIQEDALHELRDRFGQLGLKPILVSTAAQKGIRDLVFSIANELERSKRGQRQLEGDSGD